MSVSKWSFLEVKMDWKGPRVVAEVKVVQGSGLEALRALTLFVYMLTQPG